MNMDFLRHPLPGPFAQGYNESDFWTLIAVIFIAATWVEVLLWLYARKPTTVRRRLLIGTIGLLVTLWMFVEFCFYVLRFT